MAALMAVRTAGCWAVWWGHLMADLTVALKGMRRAVRKAELMAEWTAKMKAVKKAAD